LTIGNRQTLPVRSKKSVSVVFADCILVTLNVHDDDDHCYSILSPLVNNVKHMTYHSCKDESRLGGTEAAARRLRLTDEYPEQKHNQ